MNQVKPQFRNGEKLNVDMAAFILLELTEKAKNYKEQN